MKATLIISVYKDTRALRAVLDSLKRQTEQDIEVIISEDGKDAQMAAFIRQYDFPWSMQHLTQPDEGWRKERALNKAVVAAKNEWLIFIDGDCVLHPRFIEWHVREQQRGVMLAGKRVKLNPALSERYLQGEKLHLWLYLFWHRGCRYVEEAFYCGLAQWLRRPVKHLVGSNMSMSKQDLMSINGFDENYTLPATGEDYDIEWRMQANGCKIVSLRNLAVQYHLYHKENWHDHEQNMVYCRAQQEKNEYICQNGIRK
ncbi:MAG: glycosyltransferase [Paludibacteraceae bacterium]|nr:glycosyltransferase [Paludibacteraceae bacterium]